MNNPYLSNMNPKTPQQFQDELNAMQQQYSQRYNQFMANSNASVPNTYSWKYQESENEIESLQVPANGSPFMLVGNGIFYIKKFVNGQPYISAYSFQPINNIGEPKKEEKAPDLGSILQNISDRLDKLEGKNNSNPFKEGALNEQSNNSNAKND